MNMRFALIVLASATLVAQSLVTTVAAGGTTRPLPPY